MLNTKLTKQLLRIAMAYARGQNFGEGWDNQAPAMIPADVKNTREIADMIVKNNYVR